MPGSKRRHLGCGRRPRQEIQTPSSSPTGPGTWPSPTPPLVRGLAHPSTARHGASRLGPTCLALLRERDAARDALAALAGEVDACITLSATGPAPLGLASTGDSAFNLPASYLHCPAVSLPLLQADGLPLGLQILGQPGQERALSSVARWLVSKGAGGR
jgi:Asp-tRNA(Asn)/Glu-tRNA(Gln) amidotransferase A subunit family amidase